MGSISAAKLTPKQVLAEARVVAKAFCKCDPVPDGAYMCKQQGMWSRSVVVVLENGKKVVVQLKDNEIDTTRAALARSMLGDIVPPIFRAKTTKAPFAYVSTFVEGTVWSTKRWSDEENVHIVSQIGALIPRFAMPMDSSAIVNTFVIPRLIHILEVEHIPLQTLRIRIEQMRDSLAEGLKELPMSLCHIDINEMNVSYLRSQGKCG